MNPHEDLRDRLADAAGAVRPSVPDGAEVRRSALLHRRRRRLGGGAALAAVAATVALAGGAVLAPQPPSVGPVAPPPAPTSSPGPAPSTTAPPTTTAPTALPATEPPTTEPPTTEPPTTEPATPPLTRAEAQAFVERMRFPQEEQWSTGAYGVGPMEVDTEVTRWVSASCADDAAMVPDALAMRTVTLPDAEGSGVRQIAVFADAAGAADAFGSLRAAIRDCLPGGAAGTVPFDTGGTLTTSLVGAQLDLGDESFWHGVKTVVTAEGGSRYESSGNNVEVLVLDRNVVTLFPQHAATSDQMRAEHVRRSVADWAEVIRPQYQAVLR